MAGDPPLSPDWVTLNAYVDGELSPGEHAAVAAAIASDAELARRVASLARLRVATAEAFAAEIDGIAMPSVPASAIRPRYRRAGLAAAAVLALAVSMLAWWTLDRPDDQALQAHLGWAAAPEHSVIAAAQRGAIEIPDLADAGLRVAHVAATGDTMHIGYLGSRGCRVSLWVTPDDEVRTRRDERQGDALIARWSYGGHSYAAIATGMPAARFAVIASSLEQATIERRMPDDATRLALQSGRDQSAPCLG
ncbi:hypothetical protein [Desertibaculum subflavum]|uniref:hypothetical protein n=1 Tax=Desertibaculum subflavum TaxID=2268458 RepID=UPI000E66617A